MKRHLSLLLVVLSVGCGSETGLLFEVTRAEDAQDLSSIDRLEFFVGLDAPGDFNVFIDGTAPRTIAMLGGTRDVFDSPYSLLVKPGEFGAQDMEQTEVMAAVLAYDGQSDGPIAVATLSAPVRFSSGEVRKYAIELDRSRNFFVTPTGCLVIPNGDGNIQLAGIDDQDCDGDLADVDCDDSNPTIGPSRQERCANGVDDNCNNDIDEVVDGDGDSFTNCEDCNDADAAVNPSAAEVCNGIDDNCNAMCDEAFDGDGDRFTTCGSVVRADGLCRDNVSDETIDCNDGNAAVNPEADEICDGLDNNCDFFCDERGFDGDSDGFAVCENGTLSAPNQGLVCNLDPDDIGRDVVDCDQGNPLRSPGHVEVCDGIDNDCDPASTVFDTTCYTRETANSACLMGTALCTEGLGGGGATLGLCAALGDTQEVAPVLCGAFEACAQNASPAKCIETELVPNVTVACTVKYTVGDGGRATLCRSGTVPTPNAGTGPCSWHLVGGVEQANYVAGFAVDGLGVTDFVGECSTDFTIDEANLDVPIPSHFFLSANSAGEDTLYELEVTPVYSVECPVNALQCEAPFALP